MKMSKSINKTAEAQPATIRNLTLAESRQVSGGAIEPLDALLVVNDLNHSSTKQDNGEFWFENLKPGRY